VCRFVEASGRMEKLTYPDLAGWRIELETMKLRPATPLEYFERMLLTNELFEDDIRFAGVEYLASKPHSTRIRVTQPHLAGEPPDLDDLVDWMSAAGFERRADVTIGAYDAMCFRRGEFWLFDVRPMNFVDVGDEIFPIDVIAQRGNEDER
jgi:hypothetical protein